MAYETILYDITGHVAKITLNIPDKKNVMSPKLLQEFSDAVSKVKQNTELRVLIITGSGKCFCAGADLTALMTLAQNSGFSGVAGMREAIRKVYDAFLQVMQVEIPTIASVNGHAIGGGLGLALCCDIRMVAESALFAANFAKLGIHPGMALTYLIPSAVGRGRALELVFTGRKFDATEAEKIGLVERVVPPEKLEQETLSLAEDIAASAPYVVRLTKKAVYKGLNFHPDWNIEFEATAQAMCSQMEDAQEGISAFFQKRKPEFKGK